MRISWADNAKAIGIILIVFGHTEGVAPAFKELIYSFHVPLFFFLSGLLLKDKYLADTFRSFTLRNIKSLIIPYASFWVISYLLWLLIDFLRNKSGQYSGLSPFDPFIGLFFGVDGADHTSYVNGPLWFFTCLFCTTTLFFCISKVRDRRIMIFILLILGLLGPLIHHLINERLPWNLELSFVAIGFYGCGYFVSRSEVFQVVSFSKSTFLAIGVLCGILLITVKFNGRVNMNRMQFGNLALFYLAAFSGIGVIFLVSHLIPRNLFFEWLSRNTIVIFSLNLPIFRVFTGIGWKVFGLEYSFKEDFIYSVLYTIGACAVCFPASYILANYFPWIVGQRTTLPRKKNKYMARSRQTIQD